MRLESTNKTKSLPKASSSISAKKKKQASVKPKHSTISPKSKIPHLPALIKPQKQPVEPTTQSASQGEVQVLYNHYNSKFPITNGLLDGNSVDEKYAFSFVHKGQFEILLFDDETSEPVLKVRETRWKFPGLVNDRSYRCEIEPDPVEEQRLAARPAGSYSYKAPSALKSLGSRTAASELITKELKSMTRDQLEDKDDRYRELIEARELEDALFS